MCSQDSLSSYHLISGQVQMATEIQIIFQTKINACHAQYSTGERGVGWAKDLKTGIELGSP